MEYLSGFGQGRAAALRALLSRGMGAAEMPSAASADPLRALGAGQVRELRLAVGFESMMEQHARAVGSGAQAVMRRWK